MIIEFCDCPRCKKLFVQDNVRRTLEKEWNTLISSKTFNTSEHFVLETFWVSRVVRVQIKTFYALSDDWSSLNQ